MNIKVNNRLKVLAVAAAAHPEKGSEPGLGWGWVEALSGYHDLWVIIGEREGNREAIEKRYDEVSGLRERLKVHFIQRPDGPGIESAFPLLYYRRYRKWHEKAFFLASQLHEEIGFDLVHQVNMTGYREPGFLWNMDLPFVWGPVGGTANVPLRFASILGVNDFLFHLAKVAFNNLQLRFHQRVLQALKRADGFVTSTSDTHEAFKKVHDRDSIVINDNGPPLNIKKTEDNEPAERKALNGSCLYLSWSGLFISRKALPLALKALSLLPSRLMWHLDIIGDGPLMSRWKKLAGELRIDQHCTWHGWVEKKQSIDIISKSDLFLFPSLHESSPAVIFEALSSGVPVICLDHCGQADIITSKCGIRIPITTPKKVIQDFAGAITRLADNQTEVQRLSAGAVERVPAFSWDRKAQAMVAVYESAIRNWEKRTARG